MYEHSDFDLQKNKISQCKVEAYKTYLLNLLKLFILIFNFCYIYICYNLIIKENLTVGDLKAAGTA